MALNVATAICLGQCLHLLLRALPLPLFPTADYSAVSVIRRAGAEQQHQRTATASRLLFDVFLVRNALCTLLRVVATLLVAPPALECGHALALLVLANLTPLSPNTSRSVLLQSLPKGDLAAFALRCAGLSVVSARLNRVFRPRGIQTQRQPSVRSDDH